MNTIAIIVLVGAGFLWLCSLIASAWIEKNGSEPIVRGYVE